MKKFAYPRSMYQTFYNETCDEIDEERSYQLFLIEREENFRREQLDRKLSSIDNLAKSISDLASAIVRQSASPTINLFIDKNTNSDDIKRLINELNV